MRILIDNGHGSNTKGKCSPDRRLLEYSYTREIAARLEKKLKAHGYDAVRIVTEQTDIGLATRCKRANVHCHALGSKNCVLVSIHCNAAGSGGNWCDATGWSGFVSPNASADSKRLAQYLYSEAEKRGLKGNRSVPSERYWIKNLAMCRDTNCPAVLTENLFQDNKGDVDFLLSEEGKQAITDLHFAALVRYINEKGGKQ